jgi:RNA polymerase sigma factor (sigma-70 family)
VFIFKIKVSILICKEDNMTNEMVLTFDPLIKNIAKKFYGIDYDDLIQAGRYGLHLAWLHYKKEENTKFSTFAYNYIFGEMYSLTLKNKTIKQNRENVKILKLVEKTKELLTQKLNRIPTINDISIYLNIDESIINNALIEGNATLSLDQEEDEDTNLYNTFGLIEDNDLKIDLNNTISALENDEQKIIKYRYFNNLSQQETAKILGYSQVKVSRYEKRSLNKMQKYLCCE